MSDSDGSLVGVLASFDCVVEVGVGRRPSVAGALAARGVEVVATDVVERSVPTGVEFVVDDVTDPDPSVYAGADVVFARNLPPELQRPTKAVAESVDAPLYFTTLGGDPAVIPVERRTVGRETLFVG